MFGRALTSVFWGMIADRYGRKPVIMFGTFSVSVPVPDFFFLISVFYVLVFSFFPFMTSCYFKIKFCISILILFYLSYILMFVSGLFSTLSSALVQIFGLQFLHAFFLEVCVAFLAP